MRQRGLRPIQPSDESTLARCAGTWHWHHGNWHGRLNTFVRGSLTAGRCEPAGGHRIGLGLVHVLGDAVLRVGVALDVAAEHLRRPSKSKWW